MADSTVLTTPVICENDFHVTSPNLQQQEWKWSQLFNYANISLTTICYGRMYFAPVHCAPWLGSVGAVLLPDKTSGGSLQECLCIVHRGGGE